MLNLETLLVDISNNNQYFVLIANGFNVKFRDWSTYDTTFSEGAHLDPRIILFGLNQLITEPKHILEHSSTFLCLIGEKIKCKREKIINIS